MDKSKIIKINNFCRDHSEIILVYLFGSQATGRTGPLSDIDLAFLVDKTITGQSAYPYGYQAHLTSDMISLLGSNNVDVIILNNAPPLLKFQVIHRGEVIFCRSESDRLNFYIRAFNEYQDFKPMLAVQHEYLVKRINTPEIGEA
jgi:predicted nucleotidyltransferase